MFNKEFLKTLTIMYVEDDETIRVSLAGILSKIFGEVIICNDGASGLEQFKNYTFDQKIKIDAIISDINMPNMNGIEMVQAIRESDTEVPIVFTTAHGEANYLMDAIKLQIAYYALKPIDTTELLENISKFCMIEHNKKVIENKTKEITQYMDIMHHISTIFNVDLDGNIFESNMMLSQLSEYSQKELLSMKIDAILHNDALVTSYESIAQMVKENSLYKGKLKFSSKSGNTFYLNTTVLPMYNDSTNELQGYIYIGIDQTIDELEKQKTMQRVRQNIVTQRSKESGLVSHIKELENDIVKLKNTTLSSSDTQLILDKLSKEKQKVSALTLQIEHYEEKISSLTKQKDEMISGGINKIRDKSKNNKDSIQENRKLQTKIIELQSKVSKLEAKLRPNTY
ncbi:MAG: response regulator [Campylobacterota bacterium]|nr:response regulator [Campylobacterota bacterium]